MGVQERVRQWPLVGRDGELDAFATAWANRRCQGLVICGPAGVGKTRLAEGCLARAVREGFKSARVTASVVAATVPLGAIAHLIPAGVDLSNPVAGFAQVAQVLSGAPEQRRRWAVWVDDLHLLDTTSAVLLRQLMDAGVIRLIGTVRTGEPVTEAVEALTLGDAVHRIDLSVFTQEQAGVVLQAALDGPVGRSTLHELHTASGGNVLYLRELVLGALQAGALSNDEGIWELAATAPVGTPRLAELIEARLATADPRARSVLELLALCEPIALADAQQGTSISTLAGLEEAGLVQVTTERRRTTLRLAHPLYGEILRAGIPALRRRTLLLAQADRVESHGARRREDALHIATWRLAATGTAAPSLLVQAATLARHAHDYKQTATLLEVLPFSHQTVQTSLLYGDALLHLGASKHAEAVLAEADAKAITEEDKIAVTMARTMTLAWGRADPTAALAVNDAARRQVVSPAGRRALQVNEGAMRIAAGEPARGLAMLSHLEADPFQAASVDSWLIGAMMKTMGLTVLGRPIEAIGWAEHVDRVHRQVDEKALRPHPASASHYKGVALGESGQLREARAACTYAFDALIAVRARMPQLRSSLFLARTEWLSGHAAAARRWYAECVTLSQTQNQFREMRLALSGLAAAAAVLGDLETARETLNDIPNSDYPVPGFFVGEEHLGEAWLYAASGDLSRARQVLAQAAKTAREADNITSEALLLTDVARLGDAEAVVDRLTELSQLCNGTFAPARARLATALAANNPDLLLAAATDLEAIGADLLAAEAATVASSLWRRFGQPRRAAAAAVQAQACATRCPGVGTPLLTTAEAVAALTAREREVALLASAGTSSKDIAAILHLSVRTVDNHLQHAYSKLGVTTRRELADTLGQATSRRSV
ncbi:LuxR C-terminal-related transcriptional regulator [Streptomyces sp. NPDC005574]|uniref:helix-turn-helix transcriptional regulator n=1 Tax=Streptomyces sp. NPDC005574 TaxID=3156891 RepID=UPI0033B83332